ncbi:UNVERIFIED_CONTAM: hypothetical protein Sradi_2347900 [Sesamum radiatum]|uniref:Uncharacterized protein n=1 Tax=Sesamum radiatum TaxID=300843 RepID=A0AAW2T8L4_SESRA
MHINKITLCHRGSYTGVLTVGGAAAGGGGAGVATGAADCCLASSGASAIPYGPASSRVCGVADGPIVGSDGGSRRAAGGGGGAGVATGAADCCLASSGAGAILDGPASSRVCGLADGPIVGSDGGSRKTASPT